MQKNIFIGIIAFCAIITLSACQKSPEQVVDNVVQKQIEEMPQKNEGTIMGSLKDLVHLGSSQKCEWSDGVDMKGIVYIDGDRMRTDVTGATTEDDHNGMTSMINDGVWIFTWDDATKEGVKIKNDMMDDDMMDDEVDVPLLDDEADDMMVEEMAEDDMYEYSCSSWKVDELMFVPPADVVFQDMSTLTEQMQNLDSAAYCDTLPASEKAACLESLEQMNMDMLIAPQ